MWYDRVVAFHDAAPDDGQELTEIVVRMNLHKDILLSG